jgi:hypothetical protein
MNCEIIGFQGDCIDNNHERWDTVVGILDL